MSYTFTGDIQQDKRLFATYTHELCDTIRRDKTIPHTQRNAMVQLLCEEFMRTYDYEMRPEPRQLNKLADALLMEVQ